VIREFTPDQGVIVVDEAALDLAGTPVDAAVKAPRKRPRYSRHGKGAKPG